MLGIITIYKEKFVVLVNEITNAGIISKDPNSIVFEIVGVSFVPLRYSMDVTNFSPEIKSIISGMTKILTQGMYYSHRYDLTRTIQYNLVPKNSPLYDVANKDYTWNNFICKDFIGTTVKTTWLTPVIQGFVGVTEGKLKGKNFKISLISRRCTKKAGTRFNARGIDDEGHAANTVETEQILVYEDILYSFVQTRGSVPIFWVQKNVLSDVIISRSPEMTYPAFKKHFDKLIKEYKKVIIFNLLSAKKENEIKLTKSYEINEVVYEKNEGNNIRYFHFDFHADRSISVIFI